MRQKSCVNTAPLDEIEIVFVPLNVEKLIMYYTAIYHVVLTVAPVCPADYNCSLFATSVRVFKAVLFFQNLVGFYNFYRTTGEALIYLQQSEFVN